MYLNNQLKLAEHEITKGLKLKAANRLRNVINTYPDNMEARNALAQLYYEAGFYDAAGLFWMLTEPTSEQIKECTAIYEATVNHSAIQILKDIKYRGDKSGLPYYAIQKLNALEETMRRKTQSSKSRNKQLHQVIEDQSGSGILALVIVLAVVIIILTSFANGKRDMEFAFLITCISPDWCQQKFLQQ